MTREQEIVEEIRRRLRSVAADLQGYRVYLFGSRAAGTARPRSDFDVGVLGSTRLPTRIFHRIGELLDAIPTLYGIDWVDLNQVPESFRREALKHVEVLHG